MASSRLSPRAEHPGPPRASTRIEPQELLVSLFAAFGRSTEPVIRSATLPPLLTLFGFSIGAAKVAVNRVVARGLIERRRDDGRYYCVPSPRLAELIEVGDRRMHDLAAQRTWDGTWTVVWNSLPDRLRRERHRLSRRLRFLGFGPLEDNVWVTPWREAEHVLEFAAANSIDQYLTLFEGLDPFGSVDAMISRAWDLDEVALRYSSFIDEFDRDDLSRLQGQEAFEIYIRALNTFRRFPYLDPVLPQDKFSVGDARQRTCDVYQSLAEELRKRAESFFVDWTS